MSLFMLPHPCYLIHTLYDRAEVSLSGNVLSPLHLTHVDMFPLQGDQVYKSVFIIFFQGDQLKTRVKKICEG